MNRTASVIPLQPGHAADRPTGKVVIAHRGASAYLPEHTLPAVAMAYAMGADYMEQDVIMSADDQLVVWHDLTLNRNTDVSDVYPARARADGLHYVIDFSLEELRQLRVTEGFVQMSGAEPVARYPGRFPLFESRFHIHTLAEQLEMVRGLNRAMGRDIGIYPEVKSPEFHREHGKDLALALAQELKRFSYTELHHNVYVQTFDFEELQRLQEEIFPALDMRLKLVQLIDSGGAYDSMLRPGGLGRVARYASGIGPDKALIVDPESEPGAPKISGLVEEAHQLGMVVHPYTFRQDAGHIPVYAADFDKLLETFYFVAHVDGVFTDFPDRVLEFLRHHSHAH